MKTPKWESLKKRVATAGGSYTGTPVKDGTSARVCCHLIRRPDEDLLTYTLTVQTPSCFSNSSYVEEEKHKVYEGPSSLFFCVTRLKKAWVMKEEVAVACAFKKIVQRLAPGPAPLPTQGKYNALRLKCASVGPVLEAPIRKRCYSLDYYEA